ncbi:MAG: IS66 family insertion sequence element accessory protein TnpB, partial [Lachnospiraceae bacterium]|nr:IS66 family insertion sequence element accessory protein TnpB [Lachnospiraceae bacterium]
MNEKQRNERRTDQEWMELIQECRTSGLGDKDWCEQHGIPISSFYTKITRLRKKACEIPAANHRVVRECQQVVKLPIIDETPQPYVYHSNSSDADIAAPAVILKTGGYCIEISNHAARDTIMNTLSVL